MRFRHLFSLLSIVVPLSLMTATSAHADDLGTLAPGKLMAGVDANNKPYSYIDNGKMTGFDVELLRAIGAKLGLSVDFRAQDFSGLLPSVTNQQIDLAAGSISITTDRLKMVDFSEGYLTGLLSVATLPETTAITSDKASVKGKRIGVIQGTIEDTYSDSYLPGAQIVRFPNLNAGFLSMRSKYIDGFFIDKSLVDGLQEKYPQMKIADRLDISAINLPAGFPMRKGNAKLEAAVNKTLNDLVADGTWMKLYTQFHPGYPKPASLPPYAMKTGS
ncbi:ABC transporter, substrate binding protein [Caballeronia sordidicola]|jgi:polar amino acid transport system substrate-binding protein|uniref:ABC transporter, substrate binding protein n=3 Tax=Burkholderiales TaxID=80840 RepID=A0A242M2J6_CABSO|nr:ABC transporter substrate-binding protein [Burkholderia sp. PAMC 26561]AMH43554.1 ABC transporter substrate-binding protein [Burkholderia sp. PAMC 26561]OTP65332.1 ABC transporter, substrate binding protein [Caballeronia sordidicola]